jgi:hypothetical protein
MSAMKHFLQMADCRHQRQGGFDHHPLIPGATRAQLEIGGNAISSVEADIGQDDTLVLQRSDQRQKDLIVDVGGIPVPTDNLAPVIEQPAQFHAYDPAPVRFAFLADLCRGALFPDRMNEFNPITVDDSEEGGLCQEAFTPPLMVLQQTLQARPVRQASKQGGVIPVQPPIERTEIATFEREQLSNRIPYSQ